MKRSLFYWSIFLTALIFNGCCNTCDDPTNPDCDNFDPCYGKKKVNTNFYMRAGDNGFPTPPAWCKDEIIPCDTFLSSSIHFEVPEGNEESTYEWKIGTDTTVWTEKQFELSFADHLDQVGWETRLPITLTIRTPYSTCLEDPADTLIRVTREIFFTEWFEPAILSFGLEVGPRDTNILLGNFNNSPNQQDTLIFFYNRDFNFRGSENGQWLVTGTTLVDTLMLPNGGCGYREQCNSYRHYINKYSETSVCSWYPLTKGLNRLEVLYYIKGERDRIRIVLASEDVPNPYYLEFNGKRIQ